MNSKEITQKSRTNFAWAFFGLTKGQRAALQALYAYCRVVDDIVDETADPVDAQKELDHWRTILDRLSAPSSFDPPLAWELSRAMKEFPIQVNDLRWILDGVEMDLTTKRYETFDDLLVYCDAVASAVGFAALAIFGAERERTAAYAYATGRALQLTNILRDVGEDARMGRIYLPQEDLKTFGVRERRIELGRSSDEFIKLMTYQTVRVRGYYQESKASLPKSERRQFPAAELMRKMYEALLDRIEESQFNVFPRKVKVPSPRKFAIAMSVWVPHFLRIH